MRLKNKGSSFKTIPLFFFLLHLPASMASYQELLSFSITLFLCFLSLSSSQRVTLSLYYEALCPFCAEFIVNHLPKIFELGLTSAVDLKLVPWGNTVVKPDGSIHCQHGDAECALNKIQACAINTSPDVMTHFGYIYCTERLVLEKKLERWADCLEMAGLAVGCYFNGYGNELEKRYAEETSELKPAHEFVPWVVVNNQPLGENYENFVTYVCNAYGSNEVPEACRNLNSSVVETVSSSFNNYAEKLSNGHKVCYPNP